MKSRDMTIKELEETCKKQGFYLDLTDPKNPLIKAETGSPHKAKETFGLRWLK